MFRSLSADLSRKRKSNEEVESNVTSSSCRSTSFKRLCPDNRKYVLYIQMKLCLGGDLKSWMKNTTIRRKNDVDKMVQEILSAIAYIHSKGYIHRDLKVSKGVTNLIIT